MVELNLNDSYKKTEPNAQQCDSVQTKLLFVLSFYTRPFCGCFTVSLYHALLPNFVQELLWLFELLCYFLCINKYFFTRPHFGRPFLKAFKCQRNSVSAQNIISLFKMFSFIYFNNLLGIKSKCANVDRKVLKLGNIT